MGDPVVPIGSMIIIAVAFWVRENDKKNQEVMKVSPMCPFVSELLVDGWGPQKNAVLFD